VRIQYHLLATNHHDRLLDVTTSELELLEERLGMPSLLAVTDAVSGGDECLWEEDER